MTPDPTIGAPLPQPLLVTPAGDVTPPAQPSSDLDAAYAYIQHMIDQGYNKHEILSQARRIQISSEAEARFVAQADTKRALKAQRRAAQAQRRR